MYPVAFVYQIWNAVTWWSTNLDTRNTTSVGQRHDRPVRSALCIDGLSVALCVSRLWQWWGRWRKDIAPSNTGEDADAGYTVFLFELKHGNSLVQPPVERPSLRAWSHT